MLALPDADRQRPAGHRHPADDLLVPDLPTGSGTGTGALAEVAQSNIPSGQWAVTTKFGTSTISLIRRSMATLHNR